MVTSSIYDMDADVETISDRIKRLVKQLSGKLEESDGPLIPEYMISGRGHIWCWAPTSKKMVKITRNAAAYLINGEASDDGKVLIYTAFGDIVLIDPDELELIGFD